MADIYPYPQGQSEQAAPLQSSIGRADAVLAALDALGDDAAVHIFPDDLEKCGRSELAVTVFSVRVGSPVHGKSVPLFSREQVAAAMLAADNKAGGEVVGVGGMEVQGGEVVDIEAWPGVRIHDGTYTLYTNAQPQPNGQIRLEEIDAMKEELAKIAVAVGRSKTDGYDCDWFELADDVAALAAGVPKGWSLYRLNNSEETIVVSPPDGSGLALNPQGLGLASQLLYQLATTLMGGQKS